MRVCCCCACGGDEMTSLIVVMSDLRSLKASDLQSHVKFDSFSLFVSSLVFHVSLFCLSSLSGVDHSFPSDA